MDIPTFFARTSSLLKMFLKVSVCAVVLFGGAPDLAAQEEYPDSKGKDFWLTFLPNYHVNINSTDPRSKFGDSLYIFIAATEPTSGTITYKDRFGRVYTQTVSIPNPKNIFVFRIAHKDFELLGQNNSGEEGNGLDDAGRVASAAFHVETDQDVTVYALNQAFWSSDAFLILPTDAIGEDYMVMAYNSDGDTPSEFAVVATEDGTQITITPSAAVFRLFESPIVRTLNKGEVFLVQSDVLSEPKGDLTSTEIKATKPVAVFAGQQRATTPVFHNFGNNKSRDHIVEQMPPIDTWGKSAFLVPYPVPKDYENGENNAPDSYRVLFGYDRTILTVNGGVVGTFNRGDLFEAPLTGPAVVKTTAAALVAQFKKTSDVPGGPSAGKLSDPFMMLIPPSEQFLDSYRFMNAQAYQYETYPDDSGFPQTSLEKVYKEQYISVVVPTAFANTTRLDGITILPGNFKPIPQSNYSFATIPVTDGVHTIEADTTLGLYVFGYGYANSYGYIGGMSFRPIDFEPPKIATITDCFEVRGIVHDTLLNDSKLISVTFPEHLKTNVGISVLQSTPDSLHFSAKLEDIYQDGRFAVFGEDRSELIGRDTIDIPGFTVSSQFLKSDYTIEEINEEIPPNKERCYTVRLKNYGKFTQDISVIRLANPSPEYTLNVGSTTFLKPGDTANITICFKGANGEGEFSNMLIVGNKCAERNLAAFKYSVVPDKQAPVITKNISECGDLRTLTIAEVLKSDMGIASVDILDSTNITFVLEGEFPETLNLKTALTDPYRDGFYSVQVTDSVGNSRTLRDTIQGFTIAFPEIATSGPAIVYENNSIGFFSCDSLKIMNNGTLPFVFKNSYMLENIYFSVPQTQFPLTLQPGESRMIQVCYRPLETRSDSLFRDTLIFAHNCLEQRIPLEGKSLEIIYSGNAQCDVKLRLTTEKVPAAFLLKQNAPNPVQEKTAITFALKDAAPVRITLYDARGMAVATMLDEVKSAGTYELEFIPKNIPNGLYMYELQSGEMRLSRTMLIAR
jgi:hypothetical protein